jgi:CFEM domain
MCITNMIQIASTSFGCSAGNSTCYCSDPRFGYGLSDCAVEACGAAVQAQVVSFGEAYCSSE